MVFSISAGFSCIGRVVAKSLLKLTGRFNMFVPSMRVCESKLRLLQTAHEVIWRQSYGSVGVDQICEHSHVKKGSFYHFFRSKSELTVAAYEYHWEQSKPALDRIFSAERAPLERLEAYFDHIRQNQIQYFRAYGRVLGCPFASLASELSTQDEAIR